MALGRPGRDQVFLASFGVLPSTLTPAPHNNERFPLAYPKPNEDAAANTHGTPVVYIGMNEELQKSYVIHPTNQGQRAAIASRQSMMFDPRNSPARSQMNEGYTIPIQLFRNNNTWQTPSGQHTAGELQRQPSTKRPSPFAINNPIPTRMPWDL